MLRIQQNQIELAILFENIPHRAPVDAGALHSHTLNAMPDEPVAQRFQIFGEGGKVASMTSSCLPCRMRAQTKTLFSCTSRPAQRRYINLHWVSSAASVGRNGKTMTFLRVLSALRRRRQSVVPCTTKKASGPDSQTGSKHQLENGLLHALDKSSLTHLKIFFIPVVATGHGRVTRILRSVFINLTLQLVFNASQWNCNPVRRRTAESEPNDCKRSRSHWWYRRPLLSLGL